MEIAQRFAYAGVIATAWSRYSTDRVQCEPIDAALDSLVDVGVILHDGRPPEGGAEACLAALGDMGEKVRFEACKAAMEDLSAIRQRGWQAVQSLREQRVLCRMEARRCGSHAADQGRKNLGNVIKESEKVVDAVRKSFAGLVEPVSIEEYLNTRLAPLREELSELDRNPGE